MGLSICGITCSLLVVFNQNISLIPIPEFGFIWYEFGIFNQKSGAFSDLLLGGRAISDNSFFFNKR